MSRERGGTATTGEEEEGEEEEGEEEEEVVVVVGRPGGRHARKLETHRLRRAPAAPPEEQGPSSFSLPCFSLLLLSFSRFV